MAEPNGSGSMGFILGAVVIVLAGVIWYLVAGGDVPAADEPEIQIDLPDGN